ncbi:MAG: class I SAM-dependent methyltransferase [Flavobacteriaceae bacterium]|nr:class I SAM-dependent methyltransferase [Flavobacteriaceae bacterium]
MSQKSQLNTYLKTKDFLLTGEEFELKYNEELQLLETFPQPSENALARYYESPEYISHTDSQKGLMAFLYRKVKSYSINKKCKLLSGLQPEKGLLLDVGAGTGEFLKAAKSDGWEVMGVEPNKEAAQLASNKVKRIYSSLDEMENIKFDAITLWHVLEHLPNLDKVIHKLHSLLKEGGVLIIAVPNYKSYDANYYKEFWAAYDVPRHLWHFSQHTIKTLFTPQLVLEKIKPMIFDSFYVSLLSEKYKTGKKFSLKAFWVGFRSNWSAKRTGEYSSLIYCFKKPN